MHWFNLILMRAACNPHFSWCFWGTFPTFEEAMDDFRSECYDQWSLHVQDPCKYGGDVAGPFPCEGEEPTKEEYYAAVAQIGQKKISA